MKKIIGLYIVSILFFTSCEFSPPISTFDLPFSKKNKDLSKILGTEITIKNGIDTVDYTIISTKDYNLILDKKDNDTVFIGKVSLYKGIYYFSQQLNDTAYWIYSVKINDSLITGLSSCWTQMYEVDNKIIEGNYKKIVKYKSADTTVIRLKTHKRTLHKLFSSILNEYAPDTIMNYKKSASIQRDLKNKEITTDIEEHALVSKVYPIPTTGVVNVALKSAVDAEYELYNQIGVCVLKESFNALHNQIDISSHASGVYIMIIKNSDLKVVDKVRVIKK